MVGPGVAHPLLEIHTSGGNDVMAIHELENPAAYGGNHIQPNGTILQLANGCLGPGGFADLGTGDFTPATKKHQYVFTFASGVAVQSFSLRMVDWGDFLPFGANADHVYSMDMAAYNAAGDVVDTDRIQFTAAGTALIRDSVEFGSLRLAGDACSATPGQPGNFTFHVSGPGIVRVTLQPKDRPSEDPNMALADLSFELQDSDGDGVPDVADHCPNSDLRPFVDTGAGPTSVRNTVDGEGCSIQDVVNALRAGARSHGQYVSAIAHLANDLRKIGVISEKQSAELKNGAAKAK